jgi:hypothetical protein
MEMHPAILHDALILLDGGWIEFKNLIEFLMLERGHKQIIRLVGKSALLNKLKALALRADLEILTSEFMLENVRESTVFDIFQRHVPWDNQLDLDYVIYIGNSKAVVQAKEIEGIDCNDQDTANIYGYPDCCAESYNRIQEGENWIEVYLERANEIHYSYHHNKMAILFTPYLTLHQDYFPCSLECKLSLEKVVLAEQLLIEEEMTEILSILIKHLSCICLLYQGGIWFFSSSLENNSIGHFSSLICLGYLPLNSESIRKFMCPQSLRVDNGVVQIISPEGNFEFVNGQDGNRVIVFL